jgi:hypothetical protein
LILALDVESITLCPACVIQGSSSVRQTRPSRPLYDGFRARDVTAPAALSVRTIDTNGVADLSCGTRFPRQVTFRLA